MNDWEYYQIRGGEWVVNNGKAFQFFQTDYESDAKWLTDKLNFLEEEKPFDDGIMLTDDGDLVKFKTNSDNDVFHPYTGE